MPRKLDDYRSFGNKLIGLFALLLFTQRKFSLTELATRFNCTKQTILRLIEHIESWVGSNLECTKDGNRNYYQIKKLGTAPQLILNENELYTLHMCQEFAKHLLGRQFYEEATQALIKGSAHLPDGISLNHFGVARMGTIDYTPHQSFIRFIIKAIEERKVCRVAYKRLGADRAKSFYIKPLKLFSHKDTIYLHAKMAKHPDRPYKEPDFDPLLAVHRIRFVEITNRNFEFPANYDFEKVFNQNFGIVKDKSFQVEVEFYGWAAGFVSERLWSPDQKITEIEDGIRLVFTASSETETAAWVLSFGSSANLARPTKLRSLIMDHILTMHQIYG